MDVAQEEVGGVDQDAVARLGGHREPPQHGLGEGVLHRLAFEHVRAAGAERLVGLHQQHPRPDPLELHDPSLAALAAIQAEVVRAEPGRQPRGHQQLGVEAAHLEQHRARPLVPVERDEAVDLAQAGGALIHRRRRTVPRPGRLLRSQRRERDPHDDDQGQTRLRHGHSSRAIVRGRAARPGATRPIAARDGRADRRVDGPQIRRRASRALVALGYTRRVVLWVFLAAYTGSGLAGLVYEVAWTRLLTLHLGHTTAAASAVVGAFLLGLAAGAALVGRLAARLTRVQALQAYAALEIAVAARRDGAALRAVGAVAAPQLGLPGRRAGDPVCERARAGLPADGAGAGDRARRHFPAGDPRRRRRVERPGAADGDALCRQHRRRRRGRAAGRLRADPGSRPAPHDRRRRRGQPGLGDRGRPAGPTPGPHAAGRCRRGGESPRVEAGPTSSRVAG